jgi:cytochrome c oxidase subunit 2
LGRSSARGLLALAAASLTCLATASHASAQSILDPASANAEELSTLYLLIFYMGIAVFLLVEGLIIYAVVRFRRRGPDDHPEQIHGNTSVEVAWTLVPAVIVLALAALSHRTLVATFQPPADALEIQVVGHRWWWQFTYPETGSGSADGFSTATEVHVPVGQPVILYLDSSDVIHSFWAPQLAGKTDAIPGVRDGGFGQTKVWFVASRPGRYEGQCAEFCGTQHAGMRLTVVALEPDDFQRWRAAMAEPAVEPAAGSEAARGLEIITQSACVGCHTIDGVDAMVGRTGPDLTHVASRTRLAGGTIENTAEALRNWIDDPQSMKPGTLMPDTQLSAEDLDLVVTYLETLE